MMTYGNHRFFDLIYRSLLYMSINFLKGTLPWKKRSRNKTLIIKDNIEDNVLLQVPNFLSLSL